MKNVLNMPEIREVNEAVHYKPAISIILPFDPKMVAKSDISLRLKDAYRKVEMELSDNYSAETVFLMMQKLETIFGQLNFSTHKKSLAVYLSPVFEKVLYLDIPVEEKISVDESFEIRDLIYSKKQAHKYLLLIINANESKMYLGDNTGFVRILSNTSEPAVTYEDDAPERVANFSDIGHRKEVLLEKFLRQVDKSLNIILRAYQLPLFVMGSKKIIGHFNKLTRHKNSVIDFIYGNHEDAHPGELKHILEPHIRDWRKVKETAVMHRLEEAEGSHKLVTGIRDVWNEANHHKGLLLVVEENYVSADSKVNKQNLTYPSISRLAKYPHIKDAVDDIIEKVLENGGDVDFVEEGVLSNYQQIALVKYF
jgi:hypothetical protein